MPGIDSKEFLTWLKESGLWEDYWQGKIKYYDARMRFIREKHPEIYEEMKRESRERYQGLTPQEKQRVIDFETEKHRHAKEYFVDLLGGKCQKCGYMKCIAALVFHHINPADKWSRTTSSGFREDPYRFEEDINAGKITLRCKNCHAELHYRKKKPHRKHWRPK